MAVDIPIKTLQVEFCALDRATIRADVISVSLPGSLGIFTILPGHAPLLSTLEIGVVTALYTNGERHYFSINGGVVKVLNNQVLILTETVEMDGEIDVKRARDARARAETHLRSAGRGTDINRAEVALKRASARIRTHTLATETRKER
jgi:F-type H+-transporting ATPase subunit epsilon